MREAAILPTERSVQREILKMCGQCFPHTIIHHSAVTRLVGSDKQRGMQMGAMKGDGFKPGFPDLVILWAHNTGIFLEVKRPKTGKLSDAQIAMHTALEAIGWPVAVVTSADEAFEFLRQRGAPWSGVEWRVAA